MRLAMRPLILSLSKDEERFVCADIGADQAPAALRSLAR